jgi:Protein of unknown function (DUF1524)
MRAAQAVLVLLLLVISTSQAAEYLQVRREATVYAEPAKSSAKLTDVAPGESNKPLLLELVTTERSHGYYPIYLPDSRKNGWIYKTYVRRHPGPEPRHEAYRRSLYKHWVDADDDCQDTRQEVLIRDATGRVDFEKPRKCTVVRGQWVDPYTGNTFREPRQLDVDHVVPLKNAHESGGWKWSAEKRQEYANYLIGSRHLLAVKASENRKKGAKGPDEYMPRDSAFHCEYVKEWVKIKRDWGLSLSDSERRAVADIGAGCGS